MCRCLNISTFKLRPYNVWSTEAWTALQTSAAELWQPKVTEISLFQVAEAPTFSYDYTLPLERGSRFLQYIWDLLTSRWNRAVGLIVTYAPIVSSRNVISHLIYLGRAPWIVVSDVTVVKGAGVVGLVSYREGKLAGKTCHPFPNCCAGYAS